MGSILDIAKPNRGYLATLSQSIGLSVLVKVVEDHVSPWQGKVFVLEEWYFTVGRVEGLFPVRV